MRPFFSLFSLINQNNFLSVLFALSDKEVNNDIIFTHVWFIMFYFQNKLLKIRCYIRFVSKNFLKSINHSVPVHLETLNWPIQLNKSDYQK